MLRQPAHWAAVEALAAELWERRRVRASRVRQVIRSAIRASIDAELAKRPPVKITDRGP